ncbi:unnamed protein product [Parascedosporium putredinis]|uniref:chitinase n=1 Tax=Parascedosporium putredinis TaxID=1442378 RepID=A0A9P1H369_9PEZI|nr:unnamed protein product [Parascedosporium putredinis]CAI7994265.1 unnamed protein product [Parascedosporium putredinis]
MALVRHPAELRPKFHPNTKFLVAIGGWGDSKGFDTAARDEESRDAWARNVARMVDDLGADGVDVDWEYPGGNGEDYKQIPNSQKTWEIPAYPLLLRALRTHLAAPKLLTAAVPGLERDMLAFTPATLPDILASLDFLNVMTYDLFNRRDTATAHHTGLRASRHALEAYIRRGAHPGRLNLGFAFYVRWALTAPGVNCSVYDNNNNGIGCPTGLLEDPDTGTDLGRAGAFSYHDPVPAELRKSYGRALAQGRYDGDGFSYWDAQEGRFWSFDTPEAIRPKFDVLVRDMHLGGVFAWGLGEDADEFEHFKVVHKEVGMLCRESEGKSEL